MTTPYEQKHIDIVMAAIDIFLKKGFVFTSMDEVAKKAGLSKMTLYNHFPNKKVLFEQVMVVHCQNIAHSKPLITYDGKKSPEELLETYARHMVKLLNHEKSLALMRVVIAESKRLPELSDAIWPQGKMPMHEEFSSYLDAEIRAGRLIIEDRTIAIRQFFGMIKENLVWPALMGINLKPNQAMIDQVVKHSVAMFLQYYATKVVF